MRPGTFAIGAGVVFAGLAAWGGYLLGSSMGQIQLRSSETMPLVSIMRQVDDDLRTGKPDLARRRIEAVLAHMADGELTPEQFHPEVMGLSVDK